jgi:mannose/fructose/N-acetylgalactosamine-specific phosphotransferase system component IID
MEMTLVGVVVGAIIILILIRGVGFFFARNAARNAYQNGINQQVTGRVTLHRVLTEGGSILVVG